MKRTLLLIMTAFLLVSNSKAQVGPDITSWILNPDSLANIDTGGHGGYESNVLLVQYSATEVYVSCNSIPNYAIGPWPSNPNVPAPQHFICEFPRSPVQNTGTPIYTYLGPMGLWSNGVAIYNPCDGNKWNNGTSSFTMGEDTTGTGWNRNALVFEGVSFDNCLGHPDQSGCYHHHVNPKCLYNDADSTHHSPIIGYAFDGFPIYGAYGYANATTAGAIKRMRSSYVLSTATTRTAGPSVTTYPMGDMNEDYVYTLGAGDLDAHNGRYCVTPDYPSGTYAYFVTIDSTLYPVYPFVLGRTYYGIPSNTHPHVPVIGPDTAYTGTTGVAQQPNTTIKYRIAPNPVENYAYIYMDIANMTNVKGSLYNTEGRIVKTIDYMQPSIAYTLDMTDLPSGIYILAFEGGGKTVTEKIVKQ